MGGKSIISNSYLEDIGDAIRYKKGTTETFYPSQMGDAIRSIDGIVPVGSIDIDANGVYDVTEKAEAVVSVNPDLRPLSVSENGSYQPDGFDGYSEVTVDVWASGYSDDVDDFSGGNILALISHGSEYINTGYLPKVDVEIETKMSNNTNSNQYGGILCIAYSEIRIGCQFYGKNYERLQVFATLNTAGGNIGDISDEATIFWLQACYPAQIPEEAAERPLIIFHNYRGTGYDRKGAFNFYGMKCYERGKLTKKYVPWLDDNEVPCVRELVDDEYFYNVGTGTFGYIDLDGNVHDA